MKEYLIDTIKTLGFDVKGKSFDRVVEELVHEHIRLMQEIEQDNKEFFKRELKKIVTTPTN